MKVRFHVNGFSSLVVAMFLADGALAQNLASPKQFGPLKKFGPPPIITPNVALGHYVENQFSHTKRGDYFTLTDSMDNSMNPIHFGGGYFDGSAYESALLKLREEKVYTLLNVHHTNANAYEDGNGDKIPFGYDRSGASAVLGVVMDSNNELKATFVYDGITDDKQPQHDMDAVETKRYIGKLNYRLGDADLSNTLNFEASYIDFHREADNFSIENNYRKKSPMQMLMEVDRNILTLGATHDLDFNNFHNKIGISYTHDEHLGKRSGKQAGTKESFKLNGYRFPDVLVKEIGIFDDISYNFNDANKLTLALEYDYNKAEVRKINEVVGKTPQGFAMTPGVLWGIHYDEKFDGKVNRDALSAALKYDFIPFNTQSYSLEIASIERIPSNDERFVALNPPMMQQPNQTQQSQVNQMRGKGWISNPNLKTERRNRIKASFSLKDENYINYMESHFDNNAWQIGGSVVADFAQDFIILDRARGQKGIKNKSTNIITRNVDATLYSLNLHASYNFLEHFGAKINMYYNYGENREDNRALYQIAPLEATLNLDYNNYATFGKYSLGTALRAVANQSRGDFDINNGLGIDRKMGGFALWDMYGSVTLNDVWGLHFGVNNILDKEYSEFISGSHVESVAPTQVINAPGRSFYIALHGSF